jgi:hypothetical protein
MNFTSIFVKIIEYIDGLEFQKKRIPPVFFMEIILNYLKSIVYFYHKAYNDTVTIRI